MQGETSQSLISVESPMSLWFFWRKKGGRRHLYSVGFPFWWLIAVLFCLGAGLVTVLWRLISN
jgi:hypothetical protein